jgi:DNA mismatch endonuclease, patch repair protein
LLDADIVVRPSICSLGQEPSASLFFRGASDGPSSSSACQRRGETPWLRGRLRYRPMDRFSPEKRSEIMSRVRGSGTGPERYVIAALKRAGFRTSSQPAGLPFKPDVVLPKYQTVIFVHGCFWHGHICNRAKLPSTNASFWREKISANVRRDARVTRTLRRLGWHCLHIWSCSLEAQTNRVLRRLARSPRL